MTDLLCRAELALAAYADFSGSPQRYASPRRVAISRGLTRTYSDEVDAP